MNFSKNTGRPVAIKLYGLAKYVANASHTNAVSKELNIRDYSIEVTLMRLGKDFKIELGARRE